MKHISDICSLAVILLVSFLSSYGCSGGDCWVEAEGYRWSGELYGISGTSDLDTYVVGYDIAAKYDGHKWNLISSNLGGGYLTDVWVSPSGSVYTAGRSGIVYKCDGSSNEQIHDLPGGEFSNVWGTDDNNLYVVGTTDTNGTLLHYKDGLWQEEYVWPDRCFGGVWGSSADDVYSVGCGELLHFGGVAWQELQMEFEFKAGRIWGTSADDIYAVGTNVYHYDGISWSLVNTGVEEGGVDVWGRGPDDLFYVGPEGVVVHYNGDRWIDVSISKDVDLEAVGGTVNGEVFIVGNTWKSGSFVGKVYRYNCD